MLYSLNILQVLRSSLHKHLDKGTKEEVVLVV